MQCIGFFRYGADGRLMPHDWQSIASFSATVEALEPATAEAIKTLSETWVIWYNKGQDPSSGAPFVSDEPDREAISNKMRGALSEYRKSNTQGR